MFIAGRVFGIICAALLMLWNVPSHARNSDLACVQKRLAKLNYNAGPADGIMGRRTKQAAVEFRLADGKELPELNRETSGQWCEFLNRFALASSDEKPKTRIKQAFWTPPESLEYCGGIFYWDKAFKLQRTLTRRPYPNDYGVNFAHHFGKSISETMAGERVGVFKEFILKTAKAKTFTRVNLKTRWSPIYIQSNLLRLIAIYVTYMEHIDQLRADERKILIDWGKPMVAGQMRRKQNSSADSRAASGVALMSWGSITGSDRLIKTGERQWREALPYLIGSIGKLRRHPAHRGVSRKSLSLEDEFNLTLGHVIEGAAILDNLGIDAFSIKHKGRTIHDAIDWWTTIIAKKPPAFDGFRRANHNWHIAWIPIYLSKYPDRPVSDTLRGFVREIAEYYKPKFEGVSLGGPTDCFWGYDDREG